MGKEKLNENGGEWKEKLKEKAGELKEKFKEKLNGNGGEWKDKLKEKAGELKEKFKEKLNGNGGDWKEKLKEKAGELKEKLKDPACPSDKYVCEGRWGEWPAWATRLVRTRCGCTGSGVALLAPAKIIYAKLEHGGSIDQAVTQMAEVASKESKDTLMHVDEKLVEPLQVKLALLD